MDKAISITESKNRLKVVSTMVSSILIPLAILHLIIIQDVSGHGALIEPPMRSVLWKYGFDSPINYNYMELYCGGFQNFQNNGGRCGVCGDPIQGPYENERGGKYDLGVIARSYPEGTTRIKVKIEITAHHKGYFEFKLCPNNEAEATQECLDRLPLMIEEGIQQGDPMKFFPPEGQGIYVIEVSIPPNIRCARCVLQWTYRAGNTWGKNTDGKSCLGCGMQETFINCADISIGSHGTIVNTNLNIDDSLPVLDRTPNLPARNHEMGSPALRHAFNGTVPEDTIPSISVAEKKEQLNVPITPEQQHHLKLKPLHSDITEPIHTNQMQRNMGDATNSIGQLKVFLSDALANHNASSNIKNKMEYATMIETLQDVLKTLEPSSVGSVQNYVFSIPQVQNNIDSKINSTSWTTFKSDIRSLQSQQVINNYTDHPSITFMEASNTFLHTNSANEPEHSSYPTIPPNGNMVQTREGVFQAQPHLLPEQRITESISQVRTSNLNTDQGIDPMYNPLDKVQSFDRLQRPQSSAHTFPKNGVRMANTFHTQSSRMPHRVITDVFPNVQSRMALTSAQIQQFYQKLAIVESINNAHHTNRNLQHFWKTPVERNRATLAALNSLQKTLPNTIQREALIRNVILTERQLKMDKRFRYYV
ncbi:hypothetical protein ACJMK2_025519 [Sinanodonta woodiana]|uniref:Chitin-binding type-4 domain-containing protein n=1 Tax=Sinanodonta woodiana TaxID=1069815 RepID=A0ABD3XKJ4_SINWO